MASNFAKQVVAAQHLMLHMTVLFSTRINSFFASNARRHAALNSPDHFDVLTGTFTEAKKNCGIVPAFWSRENLLSEIRCGFGAFVKT